MAFIFREGYPVARITDLRGGSVEQPELVLNREATMLLELDRLTEEHAELNSDWCKDESNQEKRALLNDATEVLTEHVQRIRDKGIKFVYTFSE